MALASFRFLSVHAFCAPVSAIEDVLHTPNSIFRFASETPIAFGPPDLFDDADRGAAERLASREHNRDRFSVGFDASADHFLARLDNVTVERSGLRGAECYRIFVDAGVALSEPYNAHYKADWPDLRSVDAVHMHVDGQAAPVPVYLHDEIAPEATIATPVLSVLDRHAGNYYHWMCEVLPRLQVRAVARELEVLPVLIKEGERAPFQQQTLAGAGAGRLLPFSWHCARFSRLYLSSFLTAGETARRVRDAFRWIRPLLGPPGQAGTPRRLYVSRDDARQRRVTNEPEIAAMLARHGFTRVALQGLSVAEQIDLFAGAEAIVLPHGAAGANLAAAPPQALVVECQPSALLNPTYWMLSRAADLRYGLVMSDDALSAQPDYAADMTIDTAKLERVVVAGLATR